MYVLQLLKGRTMTGKEIINTAEAQSNGKWSPSPGLVYPLLGRLTAQGLIEEGEKGGYTTTEKGAVELEAYSKLKQGISEKYDMFVNFGFAGRFLFNDASDRVISLISTVRSDIDRLGEKQRARYKAFLRKELNRLEKE